MQVDLLTAATATNGVPSGATAGAKMLGHTDVATLFVKSVAGSGTMTASLRLWGYHIYTATWYPLGTGAANTKGLINGGVALAEDIANDLRHAELVSGLFRIDRVYLEVVSIGGTATALTAVLDCVPAESRTM